MTEKRDLAKDLETVDYARKRGLPIAPIIARHAIRRAMEAEELLREIAPFGHRLPPELQQRVNKVTMEVDKDE